MKELEYKFKEDFIRWGSEAVEGDDEKMRLQTMTHYYDSLKVVSDCLKGKLEEKSIPYCRDFLYYIAYFASTNRSVYSISIVNDIIKLWKSNWASGEDELKALRFLLKYLKSTPLFYGGVDMSNDGKGERRVITYFNKPSLTKIDGMESLIDVLGEESFIRTVIENSYFFSADLVSAQFDDLVGSIKKSENIPARKSTQDDLYQFKDDKRYFVDGSFKCPIMLDKDGNSEVRKLINNVTGFTISQGKGSVFQNYCISHIWGKAYDPRYFTSLWNIAIVPAWGNSLMDKMADEESDEVERLAAKLKSTMEAVCWSLYKMDELKWNDLGMVSSQIKDSIKIEPQEFSVRVLTGDMCISKVLLKLSSN